MRLGSGIIFATPPSGFFPHGDGYFSMRQSAHNEKSFESAAREAVLLLRVHARKKAVPKDGSFFYAWTLADSNR